MDRQVTTSQVDASLGVNACKAYADGDYKKATQHLLDILDVEPQNWLARYYLAVCYSKTNQAFAAQRAARLIYEKCPDEEIKQKACFLVQATASTFHSQTEKPAEFGRYGDVPGVGW